MKNCYITKYYPLVARQDVRQIKHYNNPVRKENLGGATLLSTVPRL